ncbi:uncharacterized protein LOC108677297 isoform X1 [Hyalella azteca]|uniref:Uncharacterized protein LOC108677297 isoform X1 n=1 Tax=Hyalella azteca TaxID=294128 RepID=A0A8B7P4E6_HYAAZ|nr:uncharacterized protein LOC108677297 isoform X1 [Hyalella azteca]
MEGDESFSEDEWSSVQRRFACEGLQVEDAGGAVGVLHVWRWLTDAESNLRAARHINEKLQRQHQQELVRLQGEFEKIEARAIAAEDLSHIVQEKLDDALAGREAVVAMLGKEGLADVAQAPLGEQIAYLLVERRRLLEDAEELRGSPGTDREKELTNNLIKASTDLELIRRSETAAAADRADLERRCAELERTANQLRIDNDSLAFKLSEAYTELEENDVEIRRLQRKLFPDQSEEGKAGGQTSIFPIPPPPEDNHHSLPDDVREAVSEGQYSPPLSERISKRDRADATKHKHPRRLSKATSEADCRKDEGVSDDIKQYQETIAELKAESSALRSRLVTAEDRLLETLCDLERLRIRSRGRLQAVRLRHKNECVKLEIRVKELSNKLKAGQVHADAQETRCEALENELRRAASEKYSLQQRIIEDEEMMANSLVQQDLAEEKLRGLVQSNARLNELVKDLLVKKTILGIEALKKSFVVNTTTGGREVRRASTS